MILALVSLAFADCSKDTDCKGDRICERGACTDAEEPRASSKRSTRSRDVGAAERAHGGSLANGIVGWSLTGQGALFSLTGSGLGLAQAGTGVSVAVGGVGLLSLAVAGPVAGASGGRARAGLRALGEQPGPPGLRIAGWSCYGTGMLLGAVAIGVGLDGDSAGGAIGLLATIPAAIGPTLLLVDAGRDRATLGAELEVLGAGPPPLQVVPTAWVSPDGGGVGFSATW